MADDYGDSESFSIARVISRSFGLLGSNFVLYVALALLIYGIPAAASQYFLLSRASAMRIAPELAELTRFWIGFAGYLLLLMATNAVLQAGVTRAAVRQLSGEPTSFGDALGTGLRLFVPVIAIALIESIAMLLVLLFAMVPGFALIAFFTALGGAAAILGMILLMLAALAPVVLIYLMWIVTVPAYVTERPGLFSAFERSRELTSGLRFRIFVVLLSTVIASTAITSVISMMGTQVFAGEPLAEALISGIFGSIAGVITVMVTACIYVELRDVKEGVDPASLVEIFA